MCVHHEKIESHKVDVYGGVYGGVYGVYMGCKRVFRGVWAKCEYMCCSYLIDAADIAKIVVARG